MDPLALPSVLMIIQNMNECLISKTSVINRISCFTKRDIQHFFFRDTSLELKIFVQTVWRYGCSFFFFARKCLSPPKRSSVVYKMLFTDDFFQKWSLTYL